SFGHQHRRPPRINTKTGSVAIDVLSSPSTGSRTPTSRSSTDRVLNPGGSSHVAIPVGDSPITPNPPGGALADAPKTSIQSNLPAISGSTTKHLSAAQRRFGDFARRNGEAIKWTSAAVGAGIGAATASPAFVAAAPVAGAGVASIPLAVGALSTSSTMHANAKAVQEYLAQTDNTKKEKLYGVLGMLGGTAVGAGAGAAAGVAAAAAGVAAPVIAATVAGSTIAGSGYGRHYASTVGKLFDDGKI
ncbi:hypothetical protein HDU96_004673, partial [Phlyctochytrium bullatum]